MEASRGRIEPGHLTGFYLTSRVLSPSLGRPWEEPHTPAKCCWHLPSGVRERHCPVMGLYSWFSSAHTHRKDPSTFSQKASPHTPLSSSHSFTSGKGSTCQVRSVPRSWQFFVLPAVPWPVVSDGNEVVPESHQTTALLGEGSLKAEPYHLLCMKTQSKGSKSQLQF
jgi:hypothetical protein